MVLVPAAVIANLLCSIAADALTLLFTIALADIVSVNVFEESETVASPVIVALTRLPLLLNVAVWLLTVFVNVNPVIFPSVKLLRLTASWGSVGFVKLIILLLLKSALPFIFNEPFNARNPPVLIGINCPGSTAAPECVRPSLRSI